MKLTQTITAQKDQKLEVPLEDINDINDVLADERGYADMTSMCFINPHAVQLEHLVDHPSPKRKVIRYIFQLNSIEYWEEEA